MSMLSKSVLRCGTETPAPVALSLQAGPLTMIFEPDTAFLRYIRLGDHEIVRTIYAAVRDRNWNTPAPHVTNLHVDKQNQSFRLRCDVHCALDDIQFSWLLQIEGEESGAITYRFSGIAGSSFYRNRIGICVLHPIVECAGKACAVESPSGEIITTKFPGPIAPEQPFLQVRALRYEPAPGQQIEVRFEGDVFETEDQRNWTDGSFKTYSTPLEIPSPVLVEKGTRINQSVRVSLLPPLRKVLAVSQGRGAQISVATIPVLPRPPVGLVLTGSSRLDPTQLARLKPLRLGHLRTDIDFSDAGWLSRLEEATRIARQLDCKLHLALLLFDQAETELANLRQAVDRLQTPIALWLVFHQNEVVTSQKWIALTQKVLAKPDVLIAAGTREWFTELNRNRPGPDFAAFPCYTLNPQVHQVDHRSLIDNLSAQLNTVETARQFSPRPVVISPITLRPQAPPAAADVANNQPTRLPPDVDVRQMSLFGAGWTLGSLAQLCPSPNVYSLTYYEVAGWRGIMSGAAHATAGGLFPAPSGAVYPVYHLLADLAGFDRVSPTLSTHPLQVAALSLLDAQNRQRIMVANLLNEPQEIKIKLGSSRATVKYLDETNAETAMVDPEKFRGTPGAVHEPASGKIELQLLPCALARVDVL